VRNEELALLGGLDAFGDDGPPERVGEDDDGPEQDCVAVVVDLADERLVDLESLGGEMTEPAQREVPGSEVVDGELDAQGGE
jgi:hypothetical protein